MPRTTHSARVLSPIRYLPSGGRKATIPLGPCLVEALDEGRAEFIWGAQGQRSAVLPIDAVEAAEENGQLIFLD